MKSVVVVSVITFTMIFGIILASTGMLESAINIKLPEPAGVRNDENAAAARVMASLDAERDRVQRSTERLLAVTMAREVEEKVISEQQAKLAGMIAELRSVQQEVSDEREESMSRLAKVYGAMKPANAAPILESLDTEVVLEIVSRMKDRQAAKVLASMAKALAAEISSRMSLKGDDL